MHYKAPFVFGRITSLPDFTDRTSEIELLKTNFRSLVNTIIISPRRWGKSSLVNRVIQELSEESSNLRICTIDLFNVRTEEEFYHLLAREILRATSSKWEEAVKNAGTFLSRLMPRITFSPDAQSEISFGISWEELQKNSDDILDLPQKIAMDKNFRILICMDEFQNIAELGHAVELQKKLRAHWQQHSQVAYCLYGSKRHMMMDVFTNTSMPFYKFGHMLFLQKIESNDWVAFIRERFADTGKSIDKNLALKIASLVENHPYYVQQLAQQTWLRTNRTTTINDITDAHETLVDQLSLLFTGTTESLTNPQLGLLKALISGEQQLSSQVSLRKYGMGTSGNVNRIKKSLIEKDILDTKDGNLVFQDPIYQYWLRHRYFRI
jgi:hypothetical protein